MLCVYYNKYYTIFTFTFFRNSSHLGEERAFQFFFSSFLIFYSYFLS